MRQLVEKHTSDPRCATCHVRIDPIGYALEAYDAIGRRRERDLGDRPIDIPSQLRDGTEFEGLDGLRQYLVTARRDAVIRQFCRKLLGYALGRGIQLSDLPLARGDGADAREERISLLGGARGGRWQPAVPRDSRARLERFMNRLADVEIESYKV